jgi:glycerol-3-phosphate dehydrogenase
MFSKLKICIMGGGSWATAIAKMSMANGNKINWYMRRPEQIEKFKETGCTPNAWHCLVAVRARVLRSAS